MGNLSVKGSEPLSEKKSSGQIVKRVSVSEVRLEPKRLEDEKQAITESWGDVSIHGDA